MKEKVYVPIVAYTHCLSLGKPFKIHKYPKLWCNNPQTATFFAKILAMTHDYIVCRNKDYGIDYGIWYDEKR